MFGRGVEVFKHVWRGVVMFKYYNSIIIMSGRGVEVLTTFGRGSWFLNITTFGRGSRCFITLI